MDQSHNVRRTKSSNSYRIPESSRARSSPTFEQLLHVSDAPTPTPGKGGSYDDSGHTLKKSVLSKVKEKARKIKRSLSKKKHSHDDNFPEYEQGGREQDREYHGGIPLPYKTEMARAPIKETTLQTPPTVQLVSDKHILATTKANHDQEGSELAPNCQLQLTKPSPKSPNHDEMGPTYDDVSDMGNNSNNNNNNNVSYRKSKSTVSELSLTSLENGSSTSTSTSSWKLQTWGRSFSMREYFLQKLEPGEDEKALSNVITEAMTPMKIGHGLDHGGGGSDGETGAGVVGKVKEVVNSLLSVEEEEEEGSEDQIPHRKQEERVGINFPASPIPVSTNAQEYYEEEAQGRTLQTN